MLDCLFQLEGITKSSFEITTIGMFDTKAKAIHEQNAIFKNKSFLIPRIHELYPFKINGELYAWRSHQNIIYKVNQLGDITPLIHQDTNLKFHPDTKHGVDGIIASTYRFLNGQEENVFNLTIYPEDSIKFQGFYYPFTTTINNLTSNPDDLEELLFQALASRPSSFTPLEFNLSILVITGQKSMLNLIGCSGDCSYPNIVSQADVEWVTELKSRALNFFLDLTDILLKQSFSTADPSILLKTFKSRRAFKKYLSTNPRFQEVTNPELSQSVRLFTDGSYIFSFVPLSEFELDLYEIKEIQS